MRFENNSLYHIYNRSNETVFYSEENYLYFLTKVKKLISPVAEIIAWCLMPNHFHFLLVANDKGCEVINEPHRPDVQVLAKNIGTLLSTYSRALNKQVGRKGKLFSHNTKSKCLNDLAGEYNYAQLCFFYIHQNPLKAGLCSDLNEWPYSSYLDYCNKRNGKLVNQDMAYEIVEFNKENFEMQSLAIIDEQKLKELF